MMPSSRRTLALLPLSSILLSWCSFQRGAWSERDESYYAGLMVYGDSLRVDVEDGFPMHLLTAADKDCPRPSAGGYALVARLGPYDADSEPVNLTGREPLGGFPERNGGGVWLRYWTNEEFHIPEREIEMTFLVPWHFEYEEELIVPRFLLEQGTEEKNTLRLLLAQITLTGRREGMVASFDLEPSRVSIDFRWTGEDEIEILPG